MTNHLFLTDWTFWTLVLIAVLWDHNFSLAMLHFTNQHNAVFFLWNILHFDCFCFWQKSIANSAYQLSMVVVDSWFDTHVNDEDNLNKAVDGTIIRVLRVIQECFRIFWNSAAVNCAMVKMWVLVLLKLWIIGT